MASPGAPPAVHPVDRLLGTSPAVVTLRAQIRQLIRFDTLENPAVPTLLLLGETGTGKSFVARVVHDSGPRVAGPFLEVNCATLPEIMLEAELFGFEAGAFTDARRAKPGLFEAAAGGTLFLDEIDAVPLALQGKLLTALETKRVRRLGAVTDRVVDVKLIAATNADLGQRVAAGQLRADLYHRLAVVVLTLPPLRERGADVLELAQAQLAQLAVAHGLPPRRVQADAAQWLLHYPWPGNVQELGHLLERVTLLHGEETIDVATLARWCQALPSVVDAPTPPDLSQEAQRLQEALVRTGGNVAQAARLLGLSRDQVRTRMRRYGLTRPGLPSLAAPQADHVVPTDPPSSTALPPRSPATGAPDASAPLPAVLPASRPPPLAITSSPVAERRHLTVLFADLVDSTALASQMDPEAWQEVLQGYHATCAAVIASEDGYVAQYLGDGILVYFGYPQAHEDDARRAVRAGLALVAAVQARPSLGDLPSLRVRVGIHTGLVVLSAVGTRQEPLALGETPHVAARLQSVAAPGTVVCSETTARLAAGYIIVEALGGQTLKGLATPLPIYHVIGLSGAQSRLDATAGQRRTPFVGRDLEVALLRERWAQVQEGQGQVVVLSGETGIGKSRLVQVVREQVVGTAAMQLVWQGVSAQQHSPLAPVITQLRQVLGREGAPEAQLQQLEHLLAPLARPEALPLLAALLALPLPVRYPPLTLSPQRQRDQTLQTLLLWLLHIAEQQPVLLVVEDLHWFDPSTLELLDLLIPQVPTARLGILGTCRPEFTIPWTPRAHLTQVTLSRLPPPQVAQMVTGVASGKTLPAEVLSQVVNITDGVPLFVEELTKTVLEADWLQEQADGYALRAPVPPLAIPATLQDSLMARLDRLGTAKPVAQLGATLGRQFPYALLQGVAHCADAELQAALAQLVDAELLYQRGVPPQATYRFKHALIQEAAYQSLLRRTRRQYHQQIAQVLEAQFPETVATQPELLAQHYTQAGLAAQAVEYWQRAGQQVAEHAAYAEAVAHFTKGLEVLQTLPESPARHHQELALRLAMGGPLMAVKGMSAPDVHHTYRRAQELCQHVADLPQRAFALHGVWIFLLVTGALRTAQEVAEQLLSLAHEQHDPGLLLGAHRALMATFHARGEMMLAYAHAQQGRALYNLAQHRTLGLQYGYDPGVLCYGIGATTLWVLGFPEQARTWSQETLALSQAVAHAPSHAVALHMVIVVHLCRGEAAAACRHAESMVTLATESGLTHFIAEGRTLWGRALAALGQREEGIHQLRQGLATLQSLEVIRRRSYFLTLLADVYADAGQVEAGLHVLAEAHAVAVHTGELFYASETHRLTGVLVLASGSARYAEAEAHFQQALDVAHRQEARSLELRAAMSLARLWQQQGKREDARQLLAGVYGWFTEGFDTADLQEAKALLATLA